ncbi:RNHCP domain-containing protein [Numidum massiliense]|uniref:RNHCP domain-containing protein n=1 Tax=Numidum massiliense TaxID=1522315 RepID=UPI0006D5AC15|nr:RNHCP domain-containing protein [Numidum massiliense]
MSRETENTAFHCESCGRQVLPVSNGSYRNHCPFCLYSKHVDNVPGDRRNRCRGLMAPVGLKRHKKKGYQIVHECQRCGKRHVNRIAQHTVQSDDWHTLIALPFGN